MRVIVRHRQDSPSCELAYRPFRVKPLPRDQLHKPVHIETMALVLRHEQKCLENSQGLRQLYLASWFLILLLLAIVGQKNQRNRLPVKEAHEREQLASKDILPLNLLKREDPCLRDRAGRLRVSAHRLELLAEQIDKLLVALAQEPKVFADAYAILLDECSSLDQRKREVLQLS